MADALKFFEEVQGHPSFHLVSQQRSLNDLGLGAHLQSYLALDLVAARLLSLTLFGSQDREQRVATTTVMCSSWAASLKLWLSHAWMDTKNLESAAQFIIPNCYKTLKA